MDLKYDRRSDVGTMKARLSRGLGALRHVALAMRHEAGTPEFYLARANLHLRENAFAECINDCRSYMEQMEDDPSVKDLLAAAHFLRAKELDASGHHDLALDNFNEAIALAPTAPYYAARAGLHKRLGNHKEGDDDIERAIEADPEDWAGLDAKFESYRAGGLEIARDFYRDLALYKGSALHHYCLGRVCFDLGDFEGAVNCLTVAIVTDQVWPVEWPVGHNPYLLRGIAHLALGDCEAAARDRVSDIRSGVAGRSDLIERCGAEREMEDYKWALEDFERVARMKPRFLDVYRMIDGAATTGGGNRGALRMFETLLSMHPEEGQAGELRAEAQRRLERIARRDDSFRQQAAVGAPPLAVRRRSDSRHGTDCGIDSRLCGADVGGTRSGDAGTSGRTGPFRLDADSLERPHDSCCRVGARPRPGDIARQVGIRKNELEKSFRVNGRRRQVDERKTGERGAVR